MNKLNALTANRHFLQLAIQSALETSGISYAEAWEHRKSWGYHQSDISDPKYVAKSAIGSMMRELSETNDMIKRELGKPEKSGKILHIHAQKIISAAKRPLSELHSHYNFECEIGSQPDAVVDNSSSRWHKTIKVTLKLTWNSNVLKKGITPVVKWRNKPTFVLDASPVDLSAREDLDPSIEVFKVKTLQVFRDNESSSYNPDPKFKVEDAYYSHLRGTNGKAIEPAISTTENWAIRVANQRTSKNILNTFLD